MGDAGPVLDVSDGELRERGGVIGPAGETVAVLQNKT